MLINRSEAEVFRPETLASFEGKPFTIDHPDEDVSPENWQNLARGMVFNVRRGDGAARDLMLADILVTDAEAIAAVQGGMRELSCGYDAEFEVIRPGVGRQINIMGNHVALVDHGRAGGRCKIKDMENTMVKKKNTGGLMDKLRRLVRDAEAEEAATAAKGEEKAQDEEQTPVTATDEDLSASLEEIKLMLRTLVDTLRPQAADSDPACGEAPTKDEETLGDEDPTEDEEPTGDEDPVGDEEPPSAKTTDRKPQRTADAKMVRSAQRMGLLGCRVGDSADAVRRGALTLACRDSSVRSLVENITGKTSLAKVRSADVRAAFAAVSALAADSNNRRTVDSLSSPGSGGSKKPITPAEINKMNAAYYSGKGGK